MNVEVWKDIPDYEGLYQASNFGKIRSLDRLVAGRRKGFFSKINGAEMKQSTKKDGYMVVSLSKYGVKKIFLVHRLVAYSFLGKSEHQVDHLDNNRKNNNIKNLEYVSNRENTTRGKLCKLRPNKSSKYVGVSFYKNKWLARIQVNRKTVYLGRFKSEDEAGKAYQKALSNL